VQKDKDQMTQRQTATPAPQPFAGLALLLAEMQALAQLIPSFGAPRDAVKAADEAQFDNMPV
jgi:hypothetical protein